MYNTNNYNTAQYNALQQLFDVDVAKDDIVFNDFSFQSTGVITSRITYDEMPFRKIRTFDIPRENGRRIITDFYRAKRIKLEGTMKADTKSELDAKIDEMKKEVSAREGNLDVKMSNGETRRFIATSDTEIIFNREHFHITFIRFIVSFNVYLPFGSDIDFTVDALLGQSSLSLVQQIDNAGTAPSKPVIHLLLSSVSAITEISIENTTTGEKLTITESFNNNDTLLIDSEEKEVLLNGVKIEYSGVFFDFITGSNSLSFNFTGTSATYNITTKYKRNFL